MIQNLLMLYKNYQVQFGIKSMSFMCILTIINQEAMKRDLNTLLKDTMN